jgi:hypothetical protein
MVAGVISGNAGGPNSTADRDAGASHGDVNFYMGQGIVPELPIVVGRIFNYLQGVNPPGLDFPNPLQSYTELAGLGVKIANNSWNDASLRTYSLQSRTHDMLVRSANGQDGGPQMAIYFPPAMWRGLPVKPVRLAAGDRQERYQRRCKQEL